MKKLFFLFISVALLFAFTACEDEDPITNFIDTSQPQGTFTTQNSGSFTAQNSTPTAGSAELGVDSEGTNFLRFTPNFTTELGTGTVTVYFSTSSTLTFDPPNGNPDALIVAPVTSNGEMFFKLNGTVDSKFTHVILWCGSASIPFGFAPLN